MIYCVLRHKCTHFWRNQLSFLCCFVIESQNHSGWKGPLETIAAQISCSSCANESILPMTISSWVCNVFTSSITSLDSVFQCSTALTEKKCFLVFRRNLMWFFFFHSSVFHAFYLCSLPLFLSVGNAVKLSFPVAGYLSTLMRFPWTFSSSVSTSSVPSPSASHGIRDATVPWSPLWPCSGFAPLSLSISCTGKPSNGLSAPGVAFPVLSRPLPFW